MRKFDVVVLGLGAMGSAALYQLSKRGVPVLGIDQFSPPHDRGSSHGDTRITRLAIGEGDHFTPLVRRSHEIWREIERDTGVELLVQCGEIIVSSEKTTASTHVQGFFQKTVDAARRHGIPHELLDASQLRKRFAAFNIRDDEYGYFEPGAGYVRPEACITAQLALAEKRGAHIHRGERVLRFDASSDSVTVRTDRTDYTVDTLVIAAGAWLPELLGGRFLSILRVYCQSLFWFEIDDDPSMFEPDRFPVFIWELPSAPQGVYGFPVVNSAGLKIATEQYSQTTTPGFVERHISNSEIDAMYRNFVAPNFRGVSARSMKTATCLYTVTPDAGFIIDRHPASERVIVASCCSGHGFKHSAAVGEALADMAQHCKGRFDLGPFRISRFG